MSKYPTLISTFPDDIIDEFLKKLEESDDAFKEYLLTISHSYAQQLLHTFWLAQSASVSKIISTMTLEEFENAAKKETKSE